MSSGTPEGCQPLENTPCRKTATGSDWHLGVSCIPAGMQGLWTPLPVVSLRSTTGYLLGYLRHRVPLAHPPKITKNLELKILYARKVGDIWWIGITCNPGVYGGGSEYEVSLGPAGRLIWVKETSKGATI